MSQSSEQPLSGGNVADRVVRVGRTVRKPSTPATSSVEAFLEHLHRTGFAGAPRTLGRDEQGRHILEYIPGSTVDRPDLLSADDLYRIGRLIRDLHDASHSFVPPPSAEWSVAIPPDLESTDAELPDVQSVRPNSMICHNDLAPWNLVRNGDRWVFIDWDGSGPGSPLWDLAYAAQSFVPLVHGGNAVKDAVRLRFLVDGYDLDQAQRNRLPQMIADRTNAMYRLLEDGARTGSQPWARLHAEGHAKHWGQAADYIKDHMKQWQLTLAKDHGT